MSPSLSLKEVEHIADLARLELTPAEKEQYRRQLADILKYVSQLQELDTTTVPPTSAIAGEKSSLRTDKSKPGLSRDELLTNAPDTAAGQFRVPPVLE